jgi:hypothetical protein
VTPFFFRNDYLGFVLQFTLGPASKKPMHIPLLEMTPEEAAEHATKAFLDVGILKTGFIC